MSEEKKRPNRKISAGEQEGTPPEWAPVNLLETMADGISVQDLDMRIRYANAVIRRDFGDDIIGKHCFEAYERRSEQCDGCPVRECLATGRPATAQRVGFDKRGEAWFADIVATPLRNQSGEVVGAVETVRNATERKLIEQEADRRNRETAALAEVAVALNSRVGLDDILDIALRRSIDICGAAGGLIRLLDPESGLLVTRAWHISTHQELPQGIPSTQPLGISPITGVVRTSEIIIVNDMSQAPDIANSDYGRDLLKLGLNSLISVPLINDGRMVGTMGLGSFESNRFKQVNKGLLAAIASQIAISIENARLLERTLADAEQRFKTLVENSNTAILAYDAAGRITEANRAAQDLLGCGRDELIGNLPADIECCPKFIPALSQVLDGVVVTGFEHKLHACDGQTKTVVSNAAPIITPEGSITGAITTMVDITARKGLEERVVEEKANFERILDNLPVGVHMYDSDGRFIYANEAFNKMSTSPDYLGKTVDEIFSVDPPEGMERIVESVRKSLGGAAITEDYFHPRTHLWMNVSYIPIMREGRRHCLIITEDISETMRLRDRLKEFGVDLGSR